MHATRPLFFLIALSVNVGLQDEGVKRCLQELRAINKEIDDSSRCAPCWPASCEPVACEEAMRLKSCNAPQLCGFLSPLGLFPWRREADGKPTVPKLCGLVSLHTTAMRIKRCLIAYT